MSLERYAPSIPFPPYAFVPGRHPHPVTDPRGHGFGIVPKPLPPVESNRLSDSSEYLYAIDLFNAGYYWEAHESWESLWVGSGRSGEVADFLKALIKLAAAGVKAREGQRNGVERHAKRAGDLFRQIVKSQKSDVDLRTGLPIERLIEIADQLRQDPIVDTSSSVEGLPVLGIQLKLI